jgi:hypothetical protein
MKISKMNNIIGLGCVVLGLIFSLNSCQSTENNEQESFEEANTLDATKLEVTTVESQAASDVGFEDELLVDSIETAKMDSAINAGMQQPIVANRAAVEKALKPNKDGVVVLNWNIMNDIKLEECFNEDIGEYFWCPEFGSIMKSLQGKTVALKGYILPLEGGYFVLSMNPMASCYFCGGGGPQSIVDLKFKSPRAFKMDANLMFKGKLRLNKDNIEELFYVLDDADVYKVK